MTSNNRGDRIQLLQKVLKKHFKPVPATEGRTVLEQLVFASCLEDARYEAAEEAFQRMQELYFDWNEIRVTTVTELADALRNLPDPTAAAARIKRSLQSIFETRYSFDLEDMRKMNQGKAIQEVAKFSGTSRFMLAYVVQQAFGGHTIPVSDTMMNILLMTGVVTPAEAEKGQTPGLERAISKSKGYEFASCLQQLAAEYQAHPTSKNIRAVLKEAGATEPFKIPEPPQPVQVQKARRPEVPKPEPKETKEGKEVKAVKNSKETKETREAKETRDSKDAGKAKDSRKTSVTKKSLPPKSLPPKSLPPKETAKPKTASAATPAKKPVVKKITKRKPK